MGQAALLVPPFACPLPLPLGAPSAPLVADPARRDWRIGLVSDSLTRACLAAEQTVIDLVPTEAVATLRRERPDFVLIESAWEGLGGAWRRRIAHYPWWLRRSRRALTDLLAEARHLGIPTVFWNKEDGVHFDRFIATAALCDHVFTVDATCLPRYRAALGPGASLGVLPFAVQPRLHHFNGFAFGAYDALFLGSYSRHLHPARRAWQDRMFTAAAGAELPLTIYDRNSPRRARVYRYPPGPQRVVRPAVSHAATAALYRHHLVSLNVNTVTTSPTMFSRRLIEILACGGIAVTSAARSVEALFGDFCHVVEEADYARALFTRLRHGPSSDDLARAAAGAACVARDHTWAQRLATIADRLAQPFVPARPAPAHA